MTLVRQKSIRDIFDLSDRHVEFTKQWETFIELEEGEYSGALSDTWSFEAEEREFQGK
jgi:hypothetical protein